MPNVGYATLQVIPSVRGIGNELRSQLVGPAGDAGQDAGEAAGGGLKDKLLVGAAAAGVAAGAILVAGITEAMEQARITNVLKAQLGATGPDAARYGKIAGELYAKGITEDVQSAADAIRAVISGGLAPPDATNKQLKSIATQMSDVATTFGTDMSLQSQAVSALLKNGLAPDAKAALDVVTTGFQKLGPNAEDLLETFQEYPVQLKKLGLDANEALGLFSQGLQGGARDTDIIADAFKEFSIRAIDMSDGSREAYKSLGLDAEDMEKQIGRGGDAAQQGLQTVLDKLREMKDPVEREAAAVGLFGTQAEELGTSLFKLDPGKATKVFGDVSGAATQLGKDLHSGPAHEIEVFQRGVKQAFVDVLGGQVLPVLATAGGFLNRTLLPPLKTIGSTAASLIVPALKGLWTAGAAVVTWLRDMGAWLIPVGIAIGGVTLALNAQAIATGFVTAVFSVYRAAILIGTAVTTGFAGAQALLNSVMALNPFVLVAIAVVALGAALVVAYQKSETFRSIVQGAWEGIKTAALAVWNGGLKPLIGWLVAGWKMIADGALWLWRTVLQPVFSFMSTAARIVATIFGVIFVVAFKVWWAGVKLYFGLVMTAVRAVGSFFSWLWTAAISPVLGWIVAGFKLWWAGVKLYFGYVTAGLRTVGRWATWLWTNAISPVVGWVTAGFRLLWSAVKVIFGYFTAGLRTVGGWATWLWKNAVSPALSGVRSVISSAYTHGIKPVLDKLRTAIGLVGKAFEAAKNAIKIAWEKVSGIARKPVAFIVNTVYSKGIVPTWNAVAKAFGAPTLDTLKFNRGGPVYGAGTETSDDVPAWLSKNEHVWTAREVRGAGGHGAVMAMRKWAAAGGNGRAPGFKDGGGLFGWVGKAASTAAGWGSDAWDAVKSGASWLKDTLADSARAGVNAVVRPLLNQIPGLGSGFGDMIAKMPAKMISALFDFSDKADAAGASEGGKWIKPVAAALGTRYGVAGRMWSSGHHTGSDFPAPTGTAVRAVARGTVASAVSGGPYGQHITVRHGGGLSSLYAHLSAMSVSGGQTVGRGARIGAVGSTGNSSGPHLHLEARKNGRTVNPEPLLGYANGGQPSPGEMFWVGERGPELMQLGNHGATVWDSQTSLRMAAGLGSLRGFAKGTSNAKARAARKDLPGDLAGVTKALTGSAADIKKAFDALTKDLKAAGGAGKALASSSAGASKQLQSMAKFRDGLEARIEAAHATASDQKKTASQHFGLAQVGEVSTFSDLLGTLQGRQAEVKTFQKQIAGLSKRGVAQSIINQLVEMGPGNSLIDLVAGASKSQLGQLNKVAESGNALASAYGRSMADVMHDAGKHAGKGFLVGLKSQEKEVQAQMNKFGASLVSGFKKKMKIKSPSRVTRWLGAMTGAGVGVGLDDTASTVAAAAARVADAATPEMPTVSPATVAARQAASAGSAFAAGQPVTLVVQDGPTLHAYVADVADTRVDDALTTVRRSLSHR
ncbi:peptidoglycan DD-metalloendopeptidase family protein [Streptomyces hirsutus]|uniref:peptidoglycan DD-metalloendopeptidase family protein n=1 Tax=Streptomyces hirsutus TaxID=35620 RepID=UPI0036B59099